MTIPGVAAREAGMPFRRLSYVAEDRKVSRGPGRKRARLKMQGDNWIDGFTIDEVLRENGSSRTARARRSTDGLAVALRVMLPARSRTRAATEAAQAAALRDLRALQRAALPNVVEVVDAGKHGDGIWVASRWIEGRTLEDMLAGGRVSAPQSLDLLTVLAQTLDELHASGLVHAALRPANVICTVGGPMLADVVLLEDSGAALTRADPPWSRAQLAAPEHILGLPRTAASDRYALGLLAYRILTGGLPFDSRSSIDFLYATLHDGVPSVAAGSLLPLALDSVFARALAHEPVDRYPSCAAFVDDLRGALAIPAPAVTVDEAAAPDAAAALPDAAAVDAPAGTPADEPEIDHVTLVPPQALDPDPPLQRNKWRDWMARLFAPRARPSVVEKREEYLESWQVAVAEAAEPRPQPPVWPLEVDVSPSGCSIWVNGEERGELPTKLMLRGRANQVVRLEVRDSSGRILASHDLRLHPFMPRAWSPEIDADVLPFRREA